MNEGVLPPQHAFQTVKNDKFSFSDPINAVIARGEAPWQFVLYA